MSGPIATVDVRDMLCAQALAIIAQRIGRLQAGAAAAVQYNTDDVKRDLIAWANDQGHRVDAGTPGTLYLQVKDRP